MTQDCGHLIEMLRDLADFYDAVRIEPDSLVFAGATATVNNPRGVHPLRLDLQETSSVIGIPRGIIAAHLRLAREAAG